LNPPLSRPSLISHTRSRGTHTRSLLLPIQSGAGIVGRHAYSILDVREVRGAAIARQTTLTAAAPTYRHQQRQPVSTSTSTSVSTGTGFAGTASLYDHAQSSSSSNGAGSSIGTSKIGASSLGPAQCASVPIADVIDMTVSTPFSAPSAVPALSANPTDPLPMLRKPAAADAQAVIDMTLPRAAQQDAATVQSTTSAAQTTKTTELVDLTVAATMRVAAASPRDADAAAELFSDSGSLRLIRIRNPWVRRQTVDFILCFAFFA
jgi:hypothetical protein